MLSQARGSKRPRSASRRVKEPFVRENASGDGARVPRPVTQRKLGTEAHAPPKLPTSVVSLSKNKN